MEAHKVVRRRGSHIYYTIGSEMAVRLSALRARCPLPPGRFLVLISVRGWVNPRAILRLKGLGQLKNPMTSSGIERLTIRFMIGSLGNKGSGVFFHRLPLSGWNCTDVLSPHFQGKVKKTFSYFKCLSGQHNIVSRATCCPWAIGWTGLH
jgi:hypothetical protein